MVPVAVEQVAMQREGPHLCISRLHAFRLFLRIESGTDPQSCVGAGVADEVDRSLASFA